VSGTSPIPNSDPSPLSFDGKQGIEYELGWRRLTDASGVASPPIVAQLDDYVKSAVKYIWSAGNKEVDTETGQV